MVDSTPITVYTSVPRTPRRRGPWGASGQLLLIGALLAAPLLHTPIVALAATVGLVKDIYPGATSSSLDQLTVVNNTLFFAASDGTTGSELWKSDGTAAGTVLVKDIYPGANNAFPSDLTNVNGTLYFQARDSTTGRELWKSDGTVAGTVLVKDIYPGANGSAPDNLTVVNNTLFFTAFDGTSGAELWGVAFAPTLTLSGNAQPIVNGTSTPSTANGTDVGSTPVGQTLVRTFTITNTGDGNLTLAGTPAVSISGAAAGDFTLTHAPSTVLAPGGSTTFQVTFTPTAAGTRSATLTIVSDDSASPFTVAIQGTGVAQSQTITFAPLADKPLGDAPFTVSATVSSGLAVTFTSTTPAVCTVTGTTVTLVSAGTCTITADQAGNATYSAAAPVAQSFTVAAPTLSLTPRVYLPFVTQ